MAFLKLALKNRIALLDRVKRNSVIGTTGYYVYSLASVQQLQVGDYTLTVGRTVSTDAVAMNVGDVFTLEISKNGTSVDGTKYVGGPNKDLFRNHYGRQGVRGCA